MSDEFDIEEFESSMHPMNKPYIYNVDEDGLCIDGEINREWAIAIAKHFKLKGDEL